MKKQHIKESTDSEPVSIDAQAIGNIKANIENMMYTSSRSLFKKEGTSNYSGSDCKLEVIDLLGDIVSELHYETCETDSSVICFYISEKFSVSRDILEKLVKIEGVVEVFLNTLNDNYDMMMMEVHFSNDKDYKSIYLQNDIKKMVDERMRLNEKHTGYSMGVKILAVGLLEMFTMDLNKKPVIYDSTSVYWGKARFFLSGPVTITSIKKCLSDRTITDFDIKISSETKEFYIDIKVPSVLDEITT